MYQLPPSLSSKISRALLIIVVFLAVCCFGTQLIGLMTGRWRLGGLTDFFGLDVERSLPNWYSSMLWLLVFQVSVLVYVRAKENKFFAGHWAALCVLFLTFSIDEVAGIHEKIGWKFGALIHAEGYFFFPFVIPGAILALVVAASYGVFLLRHPRKVSLGIMASGALFICASVVLESFGANWAFHHGGIAAQKLELPYFLLSDTEEVFEMLSAILMFQTLSIYLAGPHRAAPTGK